MLIVQKYHSIHEIEPEFIPNIELLLQEEVPNFETLIRKHDEAPAGHVFTYFLFFGPTQNSPVGFAQLCLKPLPWQDLLPWYQKLKFWNKDHLHWKQVSWSVGEGCGGLCVFDQRFSRSGKEKVQELIKEYEQRSDVLAEEIFSIKGLQDFSLQLGGEVSSAKEFYVLDPLSKGFKSYQDYTGSLSPEVQKIIKESWKELYKNGEIKLGDYPSPLETPKTLPIESSILEKWAQWGGQVLTFERELKILGCLLVLKGKNGNVFFEPFPFEPEGDALVSDDLYTQYALLKFFEMPEARKCHLLKSGKKFMYDDREDLSFFLSQGMQAKTIVHQFQSRLQNFSAPL
jgi:hypothetical protein